MKHFSRQNLFWLCIIVFIISFAIEYTLVIYGKNMHLNIMLLQIWQTIIAALVIPGLIVTVFSILIIYDTREYIQLYSLKIEANEILSLINDITSKEYVITFDKIWTLKEKLEQQTDCLKEQIIKVYKIKDREDEKLNKYLSKDKVYSKLKALEQDISCSSYCNGEINLLEINDGNIKKLIISVREVLAKKLKEI